MRFFDKFFIFFWTKEAIETKLKEKMERKKFSDWFKDSCGYNLGKNTYGCKLELARKKIQNMT
jgi:hypothetical protein